MVAKDHYQIALMLDSLLHAHVNVERVLHSTRSAQEQAQSWPAAVPGAEPAGYLDDPPTQLGPSIDGPMHRPGFQNVSRADGLTARPVRVTHPKPVPKITFPSGTQQLRRDIRRGLSTVTHRKVRSGSTSAVGSYAGHVG